MLTRFTKAQLVAFVIVTMVAVGIMCASYVRIPQQFGFGRYDLTVQLAETGGLYPRSVITYRGKEVGQVERLELRDGGGVEVNIEVDNDVDIPKGSEVQVRSASVVGEQYINFLPKPGNAANGFYADGDVVPQGDTTTPVTTSELLTSTKALLDSVPLGDLNTTINELGTAFNGNSDDLGQLLTAGALFQEEANANLEETLDLIDTLAPVLDTQQQAEADIRGWTTNLAGVTSELAANDSSIRKILASGAPLARETSKLIAGLEPVLPALLTDLASLGEVVQVYLPSLKHILNVLPATAAGGISAVPPNMRSGDHPYPEAGLSFKLGINTPPVCTTGFEFAQDIRSPSDLSPAPIPQDSYCKVAPEDPRIVRGARNQKCPQPGSGYGATAAQCGLVFQKDVVDRDRFLTQQAANTATYDPETGRLLAPNGQFFLVDALAGKKAPATWQELLKETIGK